jgi:hypothetical protein
MQSTGEQEKLRFALLGDDPDGIAMTLALEATGRYQIRSYGGPRSGAEALAKQGIATRIARDLEELLADPESVLIIVADRPGYRVHGLRRALQSEKHVLCVYPPDHSPEAAYEAAMIQADNRCVLLPLLPRVFHPGMLLLAEKLQGKQSQLGVLKLIELRQSCKGTVLIESLVPGQKPAIPGWEILRVLGGDIAEVSALASSEEVRANEPFMLSGRYEQGGLFQMQLLPNQQADSVTLVAHGTAGQAQLALPASWMGPAQFELKLDTGQQEEQAWPTWNPWTKMVEVLDKALAGDANDSKVTWQAATRCLELDDAARRSVERGRVSVLEYPEASEEVGFKGTMTLAGCALLWVVLLLFILSRWIAWLGWVIMPVLVFFLGLQLLRWLIPKKR